MEQGQTNVHYTDLTSDTPPQAVICSLMRLYYKHGWVSGTGGGISIRVGDKVYIAPSGVHKERLKENQIFILDHQNNEICHYNPNTSTNKSYKISACQPLFNIAFHLRDAGAVIHSHSMSAVLATLLNGGQQKEFRIKQVEMIKGIRGHGFYDELVVPIIENTALEHELKDSMEAIVKEYPNTFAVLVRRHGVYIWGKDWMEAKTHAECYHYLFEFACKTQQL